MRRTSSESSPSAQPSVDRSHEPVDVLYIAGEGRSGSTLLSRMLAGPSAFAAGEVRYVWERGLGENRACECGRPFATCPFWSVVTERLTQQLGRDPDVRSMVEADRRLLRTRRAWQAVRDADSPEVWRRQEEPYASRVSMLYPVIREVAGRPVVVDSSKLALYGLLLRGDPSIRVAVIHLVRDPRASVHSWRRVKRVHDSHSRSHMPRRGLVHSAAVWWSSNYLAEALLAREGTRFVRVRYEDLVKRPHETFDAVGAALGTELEAPLIRNGHVFLAPGHAATGNPDRHVSGLVPLRLDDDWKSEMPAIDKALVTSLTFTLARRYGYV